MGFVCPAVSPVFRLGRSNALQDVGFIWARKEHDSLSTVDPQTKGRIITLYWNGRFIDIPEAEYVIDGRSQLEPCEYLLFLGRRYLEKLTADLDVHINHPLGLGDVSHRLVHVSDIRNNAHGLLWKVKVVEVEMGL